MNSLPDIEEIVFNPPGASCVLSLTGLPGGYSRIYDRSAYGNHDLITGATWVRTEGGLWALNLDGSDDYINSFGMESISLPPVTIMAWVNMNQLATSESYHVLYAKYESQVSGSMFAVMPDGTLRLYSNTAGGQTNITTTDTIATGEWHQLAGQNNLKTSRIYLDGKVSKADTGTCVADAANDLVIGDRGDRYGSLNGKIALFRLYNRVLSAVEINNKFNQERALFGV